MANSKNIFYRAHYGRLLSLLHLMVLANLVLLAIFIYLFTHRATPPTFASYEGKNTPLVSINSPLVSQRALLDWANQAAISVYNLDYVNYAKEMKQAATYFTPSGWQLFQNDFKKVLDPVVTKKLRVSAVATNVPVIIDQGMLLGHYSWKIRIPLLVTYESASTKRTQSLMADIVVLRVPATMTPKGIAIAQFYTGATSANQF